MAVSMKVRETTPLSLRTILKLLGVTYTVNYGNRLDFSITLIHRRSVLSRKARVNNR